jgi:hypothetical protein
VNQAWVVAADMGYGHQRAAYPFRDVAFERVITANNDPIVKPEDRKQWRKLQDFYEGISRMSNLPVIGPPLWRAYDRLQAIHPHYPLQDLSKPSLGSTRLARLIRNGFASSVVEHSRTRADLPVLTTFFAIALAADQAGRRDVFCVVTDTDVNRVWVAENPAKSRVMYLAPIPLSRMRLLQYGVPDENIFVTGFPLPEENTATAAADLRRRLSVLDAKGVFRAKYGEILKSVLGEIPDAPVRPLTITFPVGGAGAQSGIADEILGSIAGQLRDGTVRINLVAGVRPAVEQRFRAMIARHGLDAEIGRGIRLQLAPTKDEYFDQFNELLRETDVLWTKPSELTFYAALGVPIVMCPPLGAHEERNQSSLVRVSGGQRQEDPRAAAEWLTDWIHNGQLAFNAFSGYFHMPRHGTQNIKRVLFSSDRSKVDLEMWPPPAKLGTRGG